jgi:hypothetical protein
LPATLRLTRGGVGIEPRKGRFEVTVDGYAFGFMEYNETPEVPLVPGHHTVRALAGRYSSTQTTVRGRPWPPYLLLWRNILVNSGFPHSAQKVTRADDAPAAAAAMGPYYPRVSTCPLTTLTTKGLEACGR